MTAAAWGWWIGQTMGGAAGTIREWLHRSTSLAADADRGAWQALSGTGLFDPAAFRAWLARGAELQATLAGTVAAEGTTIRATLDPSAAADDWRAEAAALLARTAEVLAERTALPTDRVPPNPSTDDSETGAWPVAVVAVVVVGAVAAIGWCGYQASQVIDRQLARDAASKELVRTDEIARRFLDAHLERERQAGKSLPLDAATAEALAALRERQRLAAPHAPPLAAPSSGLGAGFGFGAGLLVAAAVVLAINWFAPSQG
jgi:hypothetical protein